MHASATFLLACLLAFAAGPVDAHRHLDDAPARVHPAPAHPADAALRDAMGGVRNAVDAFEHARHGHMGPEQVRALSRHLDGQITRVFRECRLEPRADASLHVILGTIARASRAMHEQPGDYAPVAAMERAIADYARLFDDPAARGGVR